MSIHNEYNIPLMEEYGFNVMANTQNSMSIQEARTLLTFKRVVQRTVGRYTPIRLCCRQVAITRLKTPYTSECIDSWGDTNYTSYIPSDGDDTKAGWNYTLAVRVTYSKRRTRLSGKGWESVGCLLQLLFSPKCSQSHLLYRTFSTQAGSTHCNSNYFC